MVAARSASVSAIESPEGEAEAGQGGEGQDDGVPGHDGKEQPDAGQHRGQELDRIVHGWIVGRARVSSAVTAGLGTMDT